MKNIKNCVLLTTAALICFATIASARRSELRHENIVIEEGRTVNEDVITDRSITVNGVLNGDAVSIGGASVTVAGALNGDLVSMGGTVSIPGAVKGDVASIGGPVEITGTVSGDVASVGGRVVLSGVGQVSGDIAAIGGSVVKGEKTVHNGEIHNLDMRMVRSVLPRVLRLSRYAAGSHERKIDQRISSGNLRWLMGGLIGIGLVIFFSILATGIILLLLPAVFFPKNVENAAAAISGEIWRACGIGALILMCFFPALIMMVISILGIPLVPFALMLFAAAGILGLSAFSVVLQGRFLEGIKKTGPKGLPGQVAAGYALMAGLLFFGKLIPLVGGVLSLIGFMLMAFGALAGLGAVWTTRMGSRVPAAPPARPSSLPQTPQQQPPQAQ